jgi:phage protein D
MAVKTPTFVLSIGSAQFSGDNKKVVHKIQVERVANGVSSFRVELVDENRSFANGGDSAITEGQSCRIELGFVEDGTAEVIEGIVTGVKTEHNKGSYLKLVVTGSDYLHYLTRGRKRNAWEKIKDVDLVSKIAGDCGLSPDSEDCGLILPYVVQNNITNLAFLFERAKRIGFHVRAEKKQLIFQKPKRKASPSFKLTADPVNPNGRLIIEHYDINPNTANVVQKVNVRSYDPKTAEKIFASAESSNSDAMGGKTDAGSASAKNSPDSTLQISSENVYSQEEAQLLAQAKLDFLADEFITGKVELEGNGNIKVGSIVSLEDIGSEFSGNYLVQKAIHTFTASSENRGYGYWTTLEVSRTGR